MILDENRMNDELIKEMPESIVGGRWFVCPNSHPYFIGQCGGATQVSQCPECKLPIGGNDHKLLETNKFLPEFDSSSSPAWPPKE